MNDNIDSRISELVNLGYSTHLIARETELSQTAVRYRIKRLHLEILEKPIVTKRGRTDEKCAFCDNQLSGLQTKYCSSRCKAKGCNNGLSYEAQKKRALHRKIEAVKRLGGCCKKCGYDKNIAALCFHHRDPLIKETGLDSRHLASMKQSKIDKELEKCDLLCLNCHTETHVPEMDRSHLLRKGLYSTD